MSYTERVVVLIDMDCFYCQVEEKLDPSLEGKPIAVVQYNQWKGGGIIAVNYVARDMGVTRQMRGDEAKEICPDIQLARVPQVRGKADLTKYRDAGKKVAEILMTFTSILERASIDEAYMDITEAVNEELRKGTPILSINDLKNTFVVGGELSDFLSNIYTNHYVGSCEDNLKLAVGAVIVEKIRAEVLTKTGYKCSAGIAHNKTLAKLVCSLHKPNKQTILPQQAVSGMFSSLPIRKIKSLGGKFGHALSETLKINYIGELIRFSENELIQIFDEKTGRWLYNISRGIDKEPVQVKLISKSIGCCKRFPGKTSLLIQDDVEHWMKELSSEISERLEEDMRENNRRGKLMTVSFGVETNQKEVNSTRAVPLKSYEIEKICETAMEVLRRNCQKSDGSYHITFLGLSIGNFESIKNVRSITSYFGKINNCTLALKTRNDDPEERDKLKIPVRKDISSYLKNMKESIKKNVTEDRSTISLPNESEPEVQNSEICDDNTNFSDSTLSLDENIEDLIFYSDGFRCGESSNVNSTSSNHIMKNQTSEDHHIIAKENELHKSASASSLGSLDDEIYLTDSASPVFERKLQGGFSDSQKSDRNFDTSKILDFSDVSEDEITYSSIPHDIESATESSVYEKCRECGENIHILDIISHMDYHYALKISKEQSPLRKRIIEVQQKNKISDDMPKKRKADQVKCNIEKYFKKREDLGSDEPTEVCSECSKKVRIIDLESHSDYHAAKRLHLELNRSSSMNRNMSNIESSEAKKQNSQNVKKTNNGSILSFFK